MSLGVPQIGNTGPGMHEIIERPECGILVNPNSPEQIGHAIRRLLLDENCRQSMGPNARKAHLDEFNYEQFEPVREMISKWCEGETTG
jgi:glycosyltransferase involved in cell wall biosynthesis